MSVGGSGVIHGFGGTDRLIRFGAPALSSFALTLFLAHSFLFALCSARAAFSASLILLRPRPSPQAARSWIAVHNFDELTVVHDFPFFTDIPAMKSIFSVLAEDPFGALILLGDDPLGSLCR